MKRLVRKNTIKTSLSAGFAAVLLTACAATPLKPAITGYTCCNLRSYNGWISSDNVQGGSVLAAGEPARFDSMKKDYYLYGTIGGSDIGLRDDYAHSKEDTLRWARRIIVTEDPRQQLATWPADVQSAVHYGRVSVGMTKAQVLMSLGYPSTADTPDLNAASWRYQTTLDDTPVELKFGEDGKLASLSGKSLAVHLIEAK